MSGSDILERSGLASKAPLSNKAANIQVSLAKKRECQQKAMKAVESLIEGAFSEAEFINLCRDFNQAYYKDVIDERAIQKLCGYPMCGNALGKMPKKQYHISTRVNKVFDITERKQFCSAKCYKASKYFEVQLPTCPLWLLDIEETLQGSRLRILHSEEDCHDSPENIGTKYLLNDEGRNRVEFEKFNPVKPTSEKCDSSRPVPVKNTSEKVDNIAEETRKLNLNTATDSNPFEKPVKLKTRERKTVFTDRHRSPVEIAEDTLRKWTTLETLRFLFGEECYRQAVKAEGQDVDVVEEAMGIREARSQERFSKEYANLCRRLTVEESNDRAADAQLVVQEVSVEQKKQLPDYEHLAREAETSRLKVSAFYRGKTEIIQKTSTSNQKSEDSTTGHDFVMPPVDSHSQKALRRRIVFDNINRMSSELLRMLELSMSEISGGLRQMVQTFNLQADTITHKPAEMMMIIVIILKMLAIREPKLQSAFGNSSSQRFLVALLQSYERDINYLDRICTQLTDVGKLIKPSC